MARAPPPAKGGAVTGIWKLTKIAGGGARATRVLALRPTPSAQYLYVAAWRKRAKLKSLSSACEHRISCTELLDGFNIPVDWVPQAQ